jgi:hypothetical protein
MTADFMTRARPWPGRGKETVMSLQWTVAVAGYLRQSENTMIMRRETALCISFAVTAAEVRYGPLHKEISNCRKEFSDSVDAAHSPTRRLHQTFNSFLNLPLFDCIDIRQLIMQARSWRP